MGRTKDQIKNSTATDGKPPVSMCSDCGAVNSIQWEKKTIDIDDKQRSFKDLSFNYCEECGNVTNVDFS